MLRPWAEENSSVPPPGEHYTNILATVVYDMPINYETYGNFLRRTHHRGHVSWPHPIWKHQLRRQHVFGKMTSIVGANSQALCFIRWRKPTNSWQKWRKKLCIGLCFKNPLHCKGQTHSRLAGAFRLVACPAQLSARSIYLSSKLNDKYSDRALNC